MPIYLQVQLSTQTPLGPGASVQSIRVCEDHLRQTKVFYYPDSTQMCEHPPAGVTRGRRWRYEPFVAAPQAQHLLQPEEEQQEPPPGSEEQQHHLEDTEETAGVRHDWPDSPTEVHVSEIGGLVPCSKAGQTVSSSLSTMNLPASASSLWLHLNRSPGNISPFLFSSFWPRRNRKLSGLRLAVRQEATPPELG